MIERQTVDCADVEFARDNKLSQRLPKPTYLPTAKTTHPLHPNSTAGNLEKSALAHPRLVVTASSVHDPDTPGGNVGPGATLGELKGFVDLLEKGERFEMVDGQPYNADKAYKDSKLLNVLFTEEMARRLAARGSKVTCNCFSPGLIPSTGLFRSQNPLFVGLFNFIAVQVLGVGELV